VGREGGAIFLFLCRSKIGEDEAQEDFQRFWGTKIRIIAHTIRNLTTRTQRERDSMQYYGGGGAGAGAWALGFAFLTGAGLACVAVARGRRWACVRQSAGRPAYLKTEHKAP
jgi:hypothetical protein